MLSRANVIIEKNLDTQIEDELSFLQNSKNILSLKESILNQANIGSTLYTPTDVPIPIPTTIATEAPITSSSNAPRVKHTRMPTANPTLEPSISTVSPTEEPTLAPSIEPTVAPTFTPAPTSSPTKEIVPAAGSVVQFKISKTENCIEFLQIQIVSTAVEAIVVSSKGDVGVFWKCVESNGQVYYYNQSSTTERRLHTAEYIEENSHQRQLAQIDFTIFVNVSRVLPKGSAPEVIIQTQQSLANDVNAAFINQTFANTLQQLSIQNGITVLVNSTSDIANQTPFLGEASVNPPTATPTAEPTSPTIQPSFTVSNTPRYRPTRSPITSSPSTAKPSATPTYLPSGPSVTPTEAPTEEPTLTPTDSPSTNPSNEPSAPTAQPSVSPTAQPSTVAPTSDEVKLQVTILAASFATKHNIPTRKNSSSCEVVGSHDARVLNLILKVNNDGSTDFVVTPDQLTYEKCSSTTSLVKSYPTFYSIKIFNTVKTRAEKCVSDTVLPKKYTCDSDISQGISSQNHLVSHQYVDVTNSGLVPGEQYEIVVTILPHNAFLTAVSHSFTITYTAIDTRKRSLREWKWLALL